MENTTMTTKQQISDTGYEAFIKESEGWNLDFSALPSVQARRSQKSVSGDGFVDERFAPLADDRPLRLRRALTDFANRNSRDREVADTLRLGGVQNDSEGREGVCHFRISETGEEIAIEIEHSGDTWSAHFNGEHHTAATRDALLSGISRELNSSSVRELSDSERREVSIICQSRGYFAGLARYISLRTGLDESEALSDANVLDPRKAKLWNEAVHSCWLMCNVDFAVTEGWQEFLAAYACGRPLNAALLDGARVAWEVQKQTMERQSILSQVDREPVPEELPAPEDFESMTDAEVERQMHDVAVAHAKRLRHGTL
jgi:hypothetical protein